jgi:hypothetical protein
VIHFIALIAAQLSGAGWEKMILDDWVISTPKLKGYGFDLWVVYLVMGHRNRSSLSLVYRNSMPIR